MYFMCFVTITKQALCRIMCFMGGRISTEYVASATQPYITAIVRLTNSQSHTSLYIQTYLYAVV